MATEKYIEEISKDIVNENADVEACVSEMKRFGKMFDELEALKKEIEKEFPFLKIEINVDYDIEKIEEFIKGFQKGEDSNE